MQKRIFTIYNSRLNERMFVTATNFREAFQQTPWYPDRVRCVIVVGRDDTLRQPHLAEAIPASDLVEEPLRAKTSAGQT